MKQEQIDVINIIQEVLKGVITAATVLNPQARSEFAVVLQASAAAPGLSPMAAAMLQDLATGASVLSAIGQTKQ